MEPLIDAARDEWRKKLGEAQLNLEVREVIGMLDESLLKSWDRELPQHMLLLLSNQVDAADKLKAAFQKSLLWRRRGLGALLAPLQRNEYQDWSKPITPFDRGNLDLSQERRQWASGAGMWTAIINRVFAGMSLSDAHSCHVRDFRRGLDQRASCRSPCAKFAIWLQIQEMDSSLPALRPGGPDVGPGSRRPEQQQQQVLAQTGLHWLHMGQLHQYRRWQNRGGQRPVGSSAAGCSG